MSFYDPEKLKNFLRESGKPDKKNILKFLKSVVIAFLLAVFIKAFFVESTVIPSASMENTLLPGDFLLVSKFSYGIKTPGKIPFTDIPLSSLSLIDFNKPGNGDIIVFKYPGDKNSKKRTSDYFVKRCIAGPGDTLEIREKKLYINRSETGLPENGKFSNNYFYPKDYRAGNVFPESEKWNPDNYGPIVIPGSGMEIVLNYKNIEFWRKLINNELGRQAVKVIGSKIFIDEKETKFYEVRDDYFFVMGDNRDNSYDSRFWGFVSRESIVGKVCLIYWSTDCSEVNTGIFCPVRWNRILKFVD